MNLRTSTHKKLSNQGRQALGYTHLGWHPIPLCWPNQGGVCACGGNHKGRDVGKAPLIYYKRFVEHPPSRNQIEELWTRWPLANIGILLRPSGLLVIDADSEAAIREVETLGVPH